MPAVYPDTLKKKIFAVPFHFIKYMNAHLTFLSSSEKNLTIKMTNTEKESFVESFHFIKFVKTFMIFLKSSIKY